MMVRPFVIDENLRERVAEVIAFAKAHIGDAESDHYQIPGDIPEHVIETVFGYRIVYSLDRFVRYGLVKRMSISVDTDGNLPNPVVVKELANLFDFQWERCEVATVPLSEDAECIMVAEPLKDQSNGT